jgi:hypothetical protein
MWKKMNNFLGMLGVLKINAELVNLSAIVGL